MIKLTAQTGEPVEIDPDLVSSVYPNDGDYDHRAKTVLIVDGQHQAVVETMAEVDRLIAAG